MVFGLAVRTERNEDCDAAEGAVLWSGWALTVFLGSIAGAIPTLDLGWAARRARRHCRRPSRPHAATSAWAALAGIRRGRMTPRTVARARAIRIAAPARTVGTPSTRAWAPAPLLAAAKTVIRAPTPSVPPSWWATLIRPEAAPASAVGDAGHAGGGQRRERRAHADAEQDQRRRHLGQVVGAGGDLAQPEHPDQGDREAGGEDPQPRRGAARSGAPPAPSRRPRGSSAGRRSRPPGRRSPGRPAGTG